MDYPTAQQVAAAINAYMAGWQGAEGSAYRGTRVTQLEKIFGYPVWIAHLEPHVVGMRDLPFIMKESGEVELTNRLRYTEEELYAEQAEGELAAAQSCAAGSEPEQVQVIASLEAHILEELLPSTTLLKQMVQAIEKHYAATPYPLPETFRLLWPAMKMRGVEQNDERYCAEMLIYLCAAVEATGIHKAPDIAPLFKQAEARIGAAL